MMITRPIVITLLIFYYSFSSAQTSDSLSKYADFFRQQTHTYQRWLDQNGFGQTLRVQEVEVRNDDLVILYLGFHTENADTVIAQWNKLKEDYQAVDSSVTLEKELFNKMTWYLDITPKQGELRLFNTYNLDSIACFKAKIYFQNDSIKTYQGLCKNEIRSIAVRSADLQKAGKKTSTTAFKKQFTKNAVFDSLVPYLRSRYERQNCDMRQPAFQLHGHSEEIHFVVTDLCKEVLYDESNPWWCEVLKSWACEGCKNCIKRERLDVHIYYGATTDGFTLKLDVAASYGSGWYDKPRDNGYHNLELDYPQYLRQYADKLSKEIFDFLTKP